MQKRTRHISTASKISFVLIALFAISCLKLCAEEVAMSPAEAQVARNKFISEAKLHVGNPYVFGAVGPDSFDCSGLIYYCARESVGIQLPRTSKAIYSYVRIVTEEKREPGDLLFFKTTSSGTVSHVGIYIGNGQFISAISDGPNSGVVVSSLNMDYWKDKYMATGQILPSARDDFQTKGTETNDSDISLSLQTKGTETNEKKSFKDNISLDGSIYGDWALLSPRKFVFSFRGVDILAHVKYAGWKNIQPGFGVDFRINTGLKCFQLPLLFSLTINDYVRAYAGPVFTFGTVDLMDTEKEIKASVFPGIIGFAFSTPSLNIKGVKLQGVQDINYTVYNNMDGASLSFIESVAAGLVMYTGIRVTLPLEIL